jgi:hypothetical protein
VSARDWRRIADSLSAVVALRAAIKVGAASASVAATFSGTAASCRRSADATHRAVLPFMWAADEGRGTVAAPAASTFKPERKLRSLHLVEPNLARDSRLHQ